MYGMEMTLLAAQMIDGYQGFNKDFGVPGLVGNFECGSLAYVYVRPTHRLSRAPDCSGWGLRGIVRESGLLGLTARRSTVHSMLTVVPPAGFEPAASRLADRRSIH